VTIDLKAMTRKELHAFKKRVETQLERIEKEEMKIALKAAEQVARKHGFSLAELTEATSSKPVKSKPKGPKAPPKYVHPEDSNVTWTGRGRQPHWIKEGLAGGKSLEHFLLAPASKKSRRPAKNDEG